MRDLTIESVRAHNSVEAVVQEDDHTYLRVRPYGNCALLNAIANSDRLFLGNVAIEDGGKSLRVNVKLRRKRQY